MELRTVRLAIAAWEKARLGATGVGWVRIAAQRHSHAPLASRSWFHLHLTGMESTSKLGRSI